LYQKLESELTEKYKQIAASGVCNTKSILTRDHELNFQVNGYANIVIRPSQDLSINKNVLNELTGLW
jgi:hypothetical protein